MKRPNTLYEGAKFSEKIISNSVNIIGFEFDGTACFRKGTKNGPEELRNISYGIESYSPYLNRDLESVSFYDVGNISLNDDKDVERNYLNGNLEFDSFISNVDLKKDNVRLLTIGGEHSISFCPIKNYLKSYDDLVLIHLDAHADLRDGYEGYHYSHASIIRRSLDYFKEGHLLIQYGIRSGIKEEYEWMKENKTLIESRKEFLDKVESINNKRPIYLTLDVDYFDPSFLPGTGTPEAGGEDFHSFISLIKILKNKNFVGADVVELAPGLDFSGNSSVFAAKLVREIILSLSSCE